MNKKVKIIVIIICIILIIIGMYLFKYKNDGLDLVAGILIGAGFGSLTSLAVLKGKSNFDKNNNT